MQHKVIELLFPQGKLMHFPRTLQLILYIKMYVIDNYDSDPFIMTVKSEIPKLGLV